MVMKTEEICPVCGFQMEDSPSDFNICPSCGTEFGLHDANSTVEELRVNWIRTGPRWWSTTDPEPVGWDPGGQIGRLLAAEDRQKYSRVYFVGSADSGRSSKHAQFLRSPQPAAKISRISNTLRLDLGTCSNTSTPSSAMTCELRIMESYSSWVCTGRL